MLWSIRGHEKKDRSVADIFKQWVNRHPNKVCFIFEDQEWTYQQVNITFFTHKDEAFLNRFYLMYMF